MAGNYITVSLLQWRLSEGSQYKDSLCVVGKCPLWSIRFYRMIQSRKSFSLPCKTLNCYFLDKMKIHDTFLRSAEDLILILHTTVGWVVHVFCKEVEKGPLCMKALRRQGNLSEWESSQQNRHVENCDNCLAQGTLAPVLAVLHRTASCSPHVREQRPTWWQIIGEGEGWSRSLGQNLLKSICKRWTNKTVINTLHVHTPAIYTCSVYSTVHERTL